jgi:MarR family transcriptional regulator, transcriptional regulator for hemolysin
MPAPEQEPIGLHLARVAKAASRAFDDALVAAGGSLPQWLVLVELKGGTHGTQRTIAQAIGVEGPTLTHHLNKMEAAGLVTRQRDPENRRVHRVALTDAGEARFASLLETVIAFDQRLRGGLADKEVNALHELLDRVSANVTPGGA